MLRSRLAGRFQPGSSYLLTSSPRSGSTLLAQVLGAMPRSCMLFEPLHLDNVPGARKAGFTWRTYVAQADAWPEGRAFLQSVFEGRVINAWTTRDMSLRTAFGASMMIVKSVRANRLLPWLCGQFALPAPVLLIRHPCSVVSSQLNSGWRAQERPEAPAFLAPYPAFQAALAATRTEEEFLAATWALDQLPPLLESGPQPWIVVTYEELLRDPRATLTRIVERWEVKIDLALALARLRVPSNTTGKSGVAGIQGWKAQLRPSQADSVLGTVRAFGLAFYEASGVTEGHLLQDGALSEAIVTAGTGGSW